MIINPIQQIQIWKRLSPKILNNINQLTTILCRQPNKKLSTTTEIWLYIIKNGSCKVIHNYFLERGINIVNIQKVSNEEAKFKSFKIKVLKSDITKIRNKGFLSEGVGIKFWRELVNYGNNNMNRFNIYQIVWSMIYTS